MAEERPRVILPESPARRGSAFEGIVRRILLLYAGFERVLPQGYYRTSHGRWTQVDSLLWWRGRSYLLEVKFRRSSVSLQALLPQLFLARQIGCEGLVLVMRREKVANSLRSLSGDFVIALPWSTLYAHLSGNFKDSYLTRDMEPLRYEWGRFTSPNGNSLYWPGSDRLSYEDDGFITLPDDVERWLRRLPLLCGENHLHPSEDGVWRWTGSGEVEESLRKLTRVEDALSGFSATNPALLAQCGRGLAHLGAGDVRSLHRHLVAEGRRIIPRAISDALTDLRLMGLVKTSSTGESRLSEEGEKVFSHTGIDYLYWEELLNNWAPLGAIAKSGIPPLRENIAKIGEHFERRYLPYRPYLQNLFNSNKLRGILDLSNYLKGMTENVSQTGGVDE